MSKKLFTLTVGVVLASLQYVTASSQAPQELRLDESRNLARVCPYTQKSDGSPVSYHDLLSAGIHAYEVDGVDSLLQKGHSLMPANIIELRRIHADDSQFIIEAIKSYGTPDSVNLDPNQDPRPTRYSYNVFAQKLFAFKEFIASYNFPGFQPNKEGQRVINPLQFDFEFALTGIVKYHFYYANKKSKEARGF